MSYITHIGRYLPSAKRLTIEVVGTDAAWKETQHTGLAESDNENIRFAVGQQLAVTDAHKDSGLRTWEQSHFSIVDVVKGKLYSWMTCHNKSRWKIEKAETNARWQATM